jgi:hypothetical protein
MSLPYRKSYKNDFDDLKNELNKEDWEYLTSTFIYSGETDIKSEFDEIIMKS